LDGPQLPRGRGQIVNSKDDSEGEDISHIIDMAERFRAAIEACEPESLPIGLQSFPAGACGDATLLLARYLRDKGHDGFVYICGVREGRSHAWLKRESLIVDITGDQFPENECRVCVTRTSHWHRQFDIDQETTADFDEYDSHSRSILRSAYARIMRHI
jgi:hypothetical protein